MLSWGKKIMSHFFSVLCGLGSVLTGQGRWCRIFKSCCLWGRRQQAAERAKYMFTTADSDMYLYRRWSGNLYFRINYEIIVANHQSSCFSLQANNTNWTPPLFHSVNSQHLILKLPYSTTAQVFWWAIRFVASPLSCQACLFKST